MALLPPVSMSLREVDIEGMASGGGGGVVVLIVDHFPILGAFITNTIHWEFGQNNSYAKIALL